MFKPEPRLYGGGYGEFMPGHTSWSRRDDRDHSPIRRFDETGSIKHLYIGKGPVSVYVSPADEDVSHLLANEDGEDDMIHSIDDMLNGGRQHPQNHVPHRIGYGPQSPPGPHGGWNRGSPRLGTLPFGDSPPYRNHSPMASSLHNPAAPMEHLDGSRRSPPRRKAPGQERGRNVGAATGDIAGDPQADCAPPLPTLGPGGHFAVPEPKACTFHPNTFPADLISEPGVSAEELPEPRSAGSPPSHHQHRRQPSHYTSMEGRDSPKMDLRPSRMGGSPEPAPRMEHREIRGFTRPPPDMRTSEAQGWKSGARSPSLDEDPRGARGGYTREDQQSWGSEERHAERGSGRPMRSLRVEPFTPNYNSYPTDFSSRERGGKNEKGTQYQPTFSEFFGRSPSSSGDRSPISPGHQTVVEAKHPPPPNMDPNDLPTSMVRGVATEDDDMDLDSERLSLLMRANRTPFKFALPPPPANRGYQPPATVKLSMPKSLQPSR